MARHALTVVGLEILDSIRDCGWSTALVSAHWLAVAMGVEVKAARSALNAAVECGWLHVVTKRPGASARYRLRSRLTQAQGQIADGEVLAVRWVDVEDLWHAKTVLRVTGTIKKDPGGPAYRKATPKTESGERGIVLAPFAVEML